MSIAYTEMSRRPRRLEAASAERKKALAPTISGVTGSLVGTGTGVALAVGSAGLLPGVDLGVLVAMGVLFGAFNGGLMGLLARLEGR